MPETFTKTPGWLDWEPNPSNPTFVMPPGAVDAHCHVFGPAAEFPYAPERKYTPCDAGKRDLQRLREKLELSRNVIVQATCHGRDNSALLDALEFFGDTARGVATVGPEITQQNLAMMHERGIRGVRFNFLKRLVAKDPSDDLVTVASKIKEFGWHIVVYFEPDSLPDIESLLEKIDVPLVIDHMGRPEVSAGDKSSEFEKFLSFVDRTGSWVKVSCPERLSAEGPFARDGAEQIYTDVVPFARRVIDEFPQRALWGTDWPHPNLKTHMPDDAVLLNYIPLIAGTGRSQQALLVDNPRNLYWADNVLGNED
ncbi:amidohydrolase family protein [Rothia uropygioeca]|uniref:amidohydrolase family protein n=1 Tax=Kocuria sp. 257 TaxID=2021970 RepID=UPI00101381A5|nr:amidohydrolase family protein [Kocuria sp. 257]